MMTKRTKQPPYGFALPSVIIASVVMLIVLLAGLVSVSSVSSSIRKQYTSKLSQEAAEAGQRYAEYCISQLTGAPVWNDTQPLKPNTNCNGIVQAGVDAYVLDTTSIKTAFEVGTATADGSGGYDVNVKSTLSFGRTSQSGAITRTENSIQKVKLALSSWKDLLVMNDTACGLTESDIVYCWGNNSQGGLGDNTTTNRANPAPLRDSSNAITTLKFRSIYGNGNKSICGISKSTDAGKDYDTYCWGYNGTGALGTGDTTNRLVPTLMAKGANSVSKYKRITFGTNKACGLSTEAGGRIYCWGLEASSNFGIGTAGGAVVSRPSPTLASGSNYEDVAGGVHHVCGIASGSIYCWGLRVNSSAVWSCNPPSPLEPNPIIDNCPGLGNRGYDTTTTSTGISSTSLIGEADGTKKLMSISDNLCWLDTSNYARCIGANFFGQNGDGLAAQQSPTISGNANINRATPYDVVRDYSNNPIQFKQNSLAGGAFATCAIDLTTQVWCWGYGLYYQLGNGYDVNRPRAVAVTSGTGFTKLFGSNWGMCGLNTTNQVLCWGRTEGSLFTCPSGVASYSGGSPSTKYCPTPTLAPTLSKDPPVSIRY